MKNQNKIITMLELLEKNYNNQSIVAEQMNCSRQYVSWVVKNYGSNVSQFKANEKKLINNKIDKSKFNDKVRRQTMEYILKHPNEKKTEIAKKAGLSSSYLTNFLRGINMSQKRLIALQEIVK